MACSVKSPFLISTFSAAVTIVADMTVMQSAKITARWGMEDIGRHNRRKASIRARQITDRGPEGFRPRPQSIILPESRGISAP
jgi:hypothetical protein